MTGTGYDALAIMFGGALGAVARWFITAAVASAPAGSAPVGTTLANLIGCAALGFLVASASPASPVSDRSAGKKPSMSDARGDAAEKVAIKPPAAAAASATNAAPGGHWSTTSGRQMHPRLLLAIRVGLLGALTTFSTFIAESLMLFHDHRYLALGGYGMANLVLGVAAFSIASRWAMHHVV